MYLSPGMEYPLLVRKMTLSCTCQISNFSCVKLLFIYTYNQKYQKLEFPQKLIQAPVVNPVVTKLNNTYFLLCTSLNFDQDADLLIYYSDNLFGPYIPFFDNPVKQDITSVLSG